MLLWQQDDKTKVAGIGTIALPNRVNEADALEQLQFFRLDLL